MARAGGVNRAAPVAPVAAPPPGTDLPAGEMRRYRAR